MNEDININMAEVTEYHDYQDQRSQAIKLLNKLKAKEAQGMAVTEIFWLDGQPTLIQSSSDKNLDSRTQGVRFGRPEKKGAPATDSSDRVPAGWEAKLDKKRRRQYTLEETPTMQFASSGMLGPEYYVDEAALEAYINSLEDDDSTTTD